MNCLYITSFFNIVIGIVQTFISLWTSFCIPSHRSLPHALWTTSWLLLPPHHRRRTFSLRYGSFFVTVCRFKTLPQTATIFLWISAGRSSFVLRNYMTECTSHLAGLWIGAAISNTCHSNKAGSTTVKRARFTGKGSRSMAVLP